MKQHILIHHIKTVAIVCLMLVASTLIMAQTSRDRKQQKPTQTVTKVTPKVTVFNFSKLVAEVKPTVLTITVLDGKTKDPSLPPQGSSGQQDTNLQDEENTPPAQPFRDRSNPVQTSGSGFLIDKKGYVLTNDHVIKNAKKISVQLADQREFDAKVIGRSPLLDLALLKLETTKGTTFRYARLGQSESLQVGEPVVAIGNAKGLGLTVTAGIISAMGRNVGSDQYDSFIQTDAAINLGNSGGPLFNRKGEVIGINTAILQGGRGIGFAIPIDVVRQVLPQLREKGRVERSQLGVKVQQVTSDLADLLGLSRPRGALITDVAPHSAASKAGLKMGDVMLSINGQPVRNHQSVAMLVAFQKPGSRLLIRARREKRDIQLKAVLQKWKDAHNSVQTSTVLPDSDTLKPDVDVPKFDVDTPKRVGVKVAPLSAQAQRRYKLGRSKGVHVRHVAKGSLAAFHEVKAGDILLEVNAVRVRSTKHAKSLLAAYNPAHPMLLLLQRNNTPLYIVLTRP